MTSDNGRNMLNYSVEHSGFQHDIRCGPHTLQLSVKESIYGRQTWHAGGVASLVELLKIVTALVAFLRVSNKMMEALIAECKRLGIKPLR